jgi:predicted nucleotidyltransferase
MYIWKETRQEKKAHKLQLTAIIQHAFHLLRDTYEKWKSEKQLRNVKMSDLLYLYRYIIETSFAHRILILISSSK